jgi:hypothetical protein
MTNQTGTNAGFQLALNLIVEILVSQKIVSQDSLIELLRAQIEELRAPLDPNLSEAALVLDQILRPLLSQDRNNSRILLNARAEGNS